MRTILEAIAGTTQHSASFRHMDEASFTVTQVVSSDAAYQLSMAE